MEPKVWLRVLLGYWPHTSTRATTALYRLADRLAVELPASAFTPHTARMVGQRFADSDPPSFDDLAAALRSATSEVGSSPRTASSGTTERRWWDFTAERLAAGANRATVLSMVQRYAPAELVPAIMAEHFRQELADELRGRSEVEVDRERRAAQPAPPPAPRPPVPTGRPLPAKAAAPAETDQESDQRAGRRLSERDKLLQLEALAAAGIATAASLMRLAALRRRLQPVEAIPQEVPCQSP